MKKFFAHKLPQLFFIFSALQLSFGGFAQGNTVVVNQTITYTKASPSGGIIANIGGNNIHSFTSGGTLSVPSGYTANGVEVLIVAGGGGGGCRHAGGGGAGGLIRSTNYTLSQAQSIVVGSGGTGALNTSYPSGNNGTQSSFAGLVATGGGGGGSNNAVGQPGGSGGGGSNGTLGGTGIAGQGNKGGDQNNGQGCCWAWGVGGGGYSAAGGSTTGDYGSNGGAGIALTISGSSVSYADGGGGGNGNTGTSFTGGNGSGGSGGNINNINGFNATANTGSGGGGGGATSPNSGSGGSGSSGIVIIKYAAPSSGTWSSDNTAIATVDVNGVVKGISAGTTNINYATVNGSSSSNYIQPVTVTKPLPITLLYFIATYNECTAQLLWKTTGEINSSYYAVENSSNGITFDQAAKIASLNTATGGIYAQSFTGLTSGITYYRLKIVDADGKYTYSKTIAVTINGNCGKGIKLKISPNPVKSSLEVTGVEKGSYLSLLNYVGKKLITLIARNTTQSLDMSVYPNGVYILCSVSEAGNIQSLKVVKR